MGGAEDGVWHGFFGNRKGTHLLCSPLPVHPGRISDKRSGGQHDTDQHAQPEAYRTRG